MAARRTQYPLLRMGVCLWVAAAFLLIDPLARGFSAELQANKDISTPLSDNPVYLIPKPSQIPLSFGLSVTPHQFSGFMDQATYAYHMNPSDADYFMTQHADVSTVVRVALTEFDCLSGLNLLVEDAERTIDCCTRKLMLTGELNLDPKNITPLGSIQKVNLIAKIYKDRKKTPPSHQRYFTRIFRQFEANKLTWNTGFRVSGPGISFKLGLGDAFMIYSTAGDDFDIGAMIRLSI